VDDRPDYWGYRLRDRMSPTQRKIAYSVGLVAGCGLWGLFGFTFLLSDESWQQAFGLPILFALTAVGFRWAPSRNTPPSMTLRARRTRAWIALPGVFLLPGALIWSVEVVGGWLTALYALVLGVLVDRWALYDFKLTDLFSDSQRQPAEQREDVHT
jgi:hypothetical protein